MDVDYLIIGGGCAGLSLAFNLLQRGSDKKILIIEPRQSYQRDKTWCFWATYPHLFNDIVSHRWNQWQVKDNTYSAIHKSTKYSYEHIRSNDFYNYCVEYIEKSPNAKLLLGITANHIVEHKNYAEVETSVGVIKAQYVLDSRNLYYDKSNLVRRHDYLLQCFVGWHVHTEKPVFNIDTVTLMDFSVDQSAGIHFLYVLPFSPYEALIEPTFFLHHPNNFSLSYYHDLLKNYLLQTLDCKNYSILHEEQGILPMLYDPKNNSATKHVFPIGARAGLLRPSTGYGFLGIQRFTDQLVNHLLKNEYPIQLKPYSMYSRWLDPVFLRVLHNNPGRGSELLMQLFKKVNSESLIHFLSDSAQFNDVIKVITAMPKKLFINHLI